MRLTTRAIVAAACLLPGATAYTQSATSASDCAYCPTMVEIPAGTAMLGVEPYEANRKRGDMPLREVSIGYRLAVAATETTRAQFRAFVKATAYKVADQGCNTWTTNRILGYVKHHRWDNPGYPQTEEHPVVCVSHTDATAYAEWLSAETGKPYRLLSSAEFEYATRAGTRGPWFWGTANQEACEYANVADATFRRSFDYSPVFHCNDNYERTAPVGRFKPNPWGLYDMLGNAWEWTDDCLHQDPTNAPLDGRAWLAEDNGECERRIPRGGSWVSGSDWVRAGAQAGDRAHYHSQLLGFRVALTLPEKP